MHPKGLTIEDHEPARPAATLREQRDNLGRSEVPAPTIKPKSNTKIKATAQTNLASKPAPLKEESLRESKEEPSLSFMRKGRSSSAIWGQFWVRASLFLVCVLLTAGLLVQVSVHERDRIVATEPFARQFLEPICDVMNCQIEPLRQIEAIAIDSSAFTKVRPDVYRLSFALKNSAQTPIAIPAVELTLTDIQDQAVVRKVFTAAEFNKQVLMMEPGAELLATVPVSIKHSPGVERISGYRLLSFYP
jgi:hypothetical protein